MRKIFTLFLAMFLTGVIYSQSKVGTTAANFLTIPVGSRATAMGGAFSALANDVTSAYWNAGGLSRLARNEFGVSYTEWLVDTKHNWLGVAFKISDDDAFAISVNQLDYGSDEVTTPEQPNGTGQRWDAQDLSVNLSYARNLTDRFSIGGTLKYITQQVWNETASAFALDIGLLFYTQLEGLRIGMNISNFGTEMKLDGKDLLRASDIDPTNAGNNPNISSNLGTDSWPLPLVFTVGLSYDAFKVEEWNWTVGADAVIPNNYSTYASFGTEITWDNLISVRGGYKGINYLFDKSAKDIDVFEEGLTAGFGLQYDFGGFFAKADYSYSDFGIFSNISRFSITIGM